MAACRPGNDQLKRESSTIHPIIPMPTHWKITWFDGTISLFKLQDWTAVAIEQLKNVLDVEVVSK